MKKTILLLFLIISFRICIAQQLEKPIIDSISGNTSVSTKTDTLIKGADESLRYLGVNIYRKTLVKEGGVNYSLVFYIRTDKAILDIEPDFFNILKDSKASIKFTDGTLLVLRANFDKTANDCFLWAITKKHGIRGLRGYEAYEWYDLNLTDIDILKRKKISFIKIETSPNPFIYEIESNNSEIIKNQLLLLK